LHREPQCRKGEVWLRESRLGNGWARRRIAKAKRSTALQCDGLANGLLVAGFQRSEAMLVLKRKTNESLIIDVHGVLVRVTVTKKNAEGVWLGVEAPRDVIVDREEVYERRMGRVADTG
jgi:carbon storage regulator CsrA